MMKTWQKKKAYLKVKDMFQLGWTMKLEMVSFTQEKRIQQLLNMVVKSTHLKLR